MSSASRQAHPALRAPSCPAAAAQPAPRGRGLPAWLPAAHPPRPAPPARRATRSTARAAPSAPRAPLRPPAPLHAHPAPRASTPPPPVPPLALHAPPGRSWLRPGPRARLHALRARPAPTPGWVRQAAGSVRRARCRRLELQAACRAPSAAFRPPLAPPPALPALAASQRRALQRAPPP